MRRLMTWAVAIAMAASSHAAPPQGSEIPIRLNMPQQPLSIALRALDQRTPLFIIFDEALVGRFTAPALAGERTVTEALSILLAGTGLVFNFTGGKTIAVGVRADAQMWAREIPEEQSGDQGPGLEQLLPAPVTAHIIGKKSGPFAASLIPPSGFVAYPRVEFIREDIEQSGTQSLDQFLRTHVLALASPQIHGGVAKNTSSIDVRGAGVGQTLILLDGRPMVSYAIEGALQQPDIRSIPIAVVERIELLSPTAAALYGAGAAGGIVNIVLRHDVSAQEFQLHYGNTSDHAAGEYSAAMIAGFRFNDDRTRLRFMGSYSGGDPLSVLDRGSGIGDVLAPPAGIAVPPLAATTNIYSAASNDPLILDDGTALDSTVTSVPYGYAGPLSDGGAALAANAGQINRDLASTAQTGGGRDTLVHDPTVAYLSVGGDHRFGFGLEGFWQFSLSDNTGSRLTNSAGGTYLLPADAPANPFQGDVWITTPAIGADRDLTSSLRQERAVVELSGNLPLNWTASLGYIWNRSEFEYTGPGSLSPEAAAAVVNGSLDIFRDTSRWPVSFSEYLLDPVVVHPTQMILRDLTLHMEGPLWSSRAGETSLSVLVEHRNEWLEQQLRTDSAGRTLSPGGAREVDSVGLAVNWPLIMEQNRIVAIRELGLQLGARWDGYRVQGMGPWLMDNEEAQRRTAGRFSFVSPTASLHYSPLPGFTLRASVARNFLPPAPAQLVSNPPQHLSAELAGLLAVTDPLRGGELVGPIEITSGGSGNLRPERAKSWSAGLRFTPRTLPGLSVEVDRLEIERTDGIAFFPLMPASFTKEPFIPGLVRRDPAGSDDPFGVGPIIGYHSGLINVAQQRIVAWDLAIRFEREIPWFGQLNVVGKATHQAQNDIEVTPGALPERHAGLMDGLDWRGRIDASWSREKWRVGWSASYYGGYYLNAEHSTDRSLGAAVLSGRTYHDFFIGCRFGERSELRPGGRLPRFRTELQFRVDNALNTHPPRSVGGNPFFSPWGDPRLTRYLVSARVEFP